MRGRDLPDQKINGIPVKRMNKTVHTKAALLKLKYKVNFDAPLGKCHISGCTNDSRRFMAPWCRMHTDIIQREASLAGTHKYRATAKYKKTRQAHDARVRAKKRAAKKRGANPQTLTPLPSPPPSEPDVPQAAPQNQPEHNQKQNEPPNTDAGTSTSLGHQPENQDEQKDNYR
jgi:hypothetical protein